VPPATTAICPTSFFSVASLRGLALAGRLSEERLTEALADYEAVPILRHGHMGLLPRALELRHNFSAYDAA
jgi:predicted nucleic acid-binding protein